jgi:3-hydroxyisobutyrate dehydrogenase-like beta-hydroxyacid dehydrogenase
MRSSRFIFQKVRFLTTNYVKHTHHQKNRKVGFIGLGNMGAGMAENLLDECPDLLVHDIVPENVQKLVQCGATAATAQTIASTCDIIVTMVPATSHVQTLLTSHPDGLFHYARKGTLFIDSSTIDPIVSKDLASEAHSRGYHFIDAPVSGGNKPLRSVS